MTHSDDDACRRCARCPTRRRRAIPVDGCAAASRSGYGFWSTKPSGSHGLQPGVPLVEGVGVEQQRQPRVDAQPEVVAAARAHAQALVELLVVEHLGARGHWVHRSGGYSWSRRGRNGSLTGHRRAAPTTRPGGRDDQASGARAGEDTPDAMAPPTSSRRRAVPTDRPRPRRGSAPLGRAAPAADQRHGRSVRTASPSARSRAASAPRTGTRDGSGPRHAASDVGRPASRSAGACPPRSAQRPRPRPVVAGQHAAPRTGRAGWPPRPPRCRARSPSSSATVRSARWMSTRPHPSERPITSPISRRGHLLHEPEHQGAAAVGRQAVDGAPRAAASSRRRRRGRIIGRPTARAPRRAAPRGAAAVARRSLASTLRQIWNSHTRKVLPSSAPVVERGQATQRLEEHLLGDVLGRVMGARLVERRSCTPGPRTSGRGSRIAAGRVGPLRRPSDRRRAATDAGTQLPLSPS